METQLNNNKVLYNKLNEYFKNNIKLSIIGSNHLIIITKEDLFYCINIYNENIPSFIINNDHVIDLMIVQDLCFEQIIDIKISVYSLFWLARDCDKNVYFLTSTMEKSRNI
jgi:hypothetical protein